MGLDWLRLKGLTAVPCGVQPSPVQWNTIPKEIKISQHNIADMVRIIFCIPEASSKSKRIFSVAGRIMTPSRARTVQEQGGNLVIMKCNMRLLRQMKINQRIT